MEKDKSCRMKRLLAVFFIIVLGSLFLLNVKGLVGIAKQEWCAIFSHGDKYEFLSPEEIENTYNTNFFERMRFVELNGLTAKLLNQKIINGAVKDSSGQLNLMSDTQYQFEKKKEKEKTERAIDILEYGRDSGAKILYVQRPWKNTDKQGMLPYGLSLQQGLQADFWCHQMEAAEIPVLDLRQSLGKNLAFYKTDHHWTTRTSFFAAEDIIEELNACYHLGLNQNDQYFNLSNYHKQVYNNSFLGSEGIKAGKYYAGKDDYEVLWPQFKTQFRYRQYVDHKKILDRTGDFYKAFIDETRLLDPDYNNKYDSYGFAASVENRVNNYNADNNNKVLLIADSFARPMFTFFSLCFAETRYLDPQEGRYNDSFIEYIKQYKPDVIVMMFPGDGSFVEV